MDKSFPSFRCEAICNKKVTFHLQIESSEKMISVPKEDETAETFLLSVTTREQVINLFKKNNNKKQ